MHMRLILLALGLSLTANVAAQAPAPKAPPDRGKAAKKPGAPAKIDFERLRRSLESHDAAELLATLAEIRALGPDGAPAAPLVEALLARGSSLAVLLAACETAGALARDTSSEALAPYVKHRNSELRQAAARALTRTKGSVARSALRRALGSPDPAVRALAARGLGTLGATEAVDDLFAVLSHDTPGAAVSIAELCAPQQCDRLMGLVGKLKFDTLEPAFVPLLLRPAGAVPEEHQLRYVDRLRRLATPSAQAVLSTALAQLGEDASPVLRRALDAAVKGRPAPKDVP